jgi:hypothetical protein
MLQTLALALSLLGGIQAAAPLPDPITSRGAGRTTEIFRWDCGSTLGHREVTLFGNGTVRLRDGERGKEQMGLAELGPDELDGALRRLAAEDLSETDDRERGPQGDWIERCALTLALPGKPVRSFRYGRYDSLSLALSRVLRVVSDLAEKVRVMEGAEHLPEGYEPQVGDVLKRVDGQLFEVFEFTTDKKAVECHGVDEPVAIYVLREELRKEFVALVSRRHR